MDKCHAPDAGYLKTSDGVAITNPDVLALYHNGPYWCRIAGLETEYANDRKFEKERVKKTKGGGVNKEMTETTKQILECVGNGEAPKEIAAKLGVSVGQVYHAKSNHQARRGKSAPATEPPAIIPPAPRPSLQLPDLANIHELIDIAARLPAIKASLLASCEEIETTARYQLSLAASIREALSA